MQLSDDRADQPDDLTGIRGVVFDVYGTLCRHGPRRSPYKRLLSQRKSEGAYWLRQVMCSPMSLAQTADALGLELPPGELEGLEHDLEEELKTVDLFPEVLEVLTSLRQSGYKIATVSNLALPYATPAKELLGDYVDVQIWSFEAGFMKPDLQTYQAVSERLQIAPNQLVFIGDNHLCDVEGPQRAGLQAILLDRDQRYEGLNSAADLAQVVRVLAGSAQANQCYCR